MLLPHQADAEIAVGPCHIVPISNFGIRAFNKDGVPGALNLRLAQVPPLTGQPGLWAPIAPFPNENHVIDPEVVYDAGADRFWALGLQYDDTNIQPPWDRWYYALAVTKTGDPNPSGPDPGWHIYRIELTGVLPTYFETDNPGLSVGANHVYLQLNSLFGDRWRVLVLEKAPLMDGTQPPVFEPGTNPFFTVNNTWSAPAVAFGPVTGSTPQYLINDGYGFGGTIGNSVTLYAIRPADPTPVSSVVLAVPDEYRKFNQAPQAGSTILISTDDGRFQCAVYRNRHVWAVHTVRLPGAVSDPDRAYVRWYRFDMHGWPGSGFSPMLIQSGTLDLPAPLYAYYPSIAVDAFDNAAIVFNVSGENKHVSMWRAVKCNSQSSFQPPVEILPGAAAYVGALPGQRNWGDYTGCDPDPDAPSIFWGHAQLPLGTSGTTEVWYTLVARFEVACGLDVNGDGFENIGDAAAFFNLFLQGQPQADYHADGRLDVQDMTAFMTDFYGP